MHLLWQEEIRISGFKFLNRADYELRVFLEPIDTQKGVIVIIV